MQRKRKKYIQQQPVTLTREPETFFQFLGDNVWGLWIIGIGVLLIMLGFVFPELGNLIVLLLTLFDNTARPDNNSVDDLSDPTGSFVFGGILVAVGVGALAFAWRVSRA